MLYKENKKILKILNWNALPNILHFNFLTIRINTISETHIPSKKV
jgi:hypothetical protein